MSIRQIYRGNPILKQYNITNNFSGGMNTTDVDEVTLTNQFRDLQNVELLEAGMIQNRKGFGFSPVFNEWVQRYNDSVEEVPLLDHVKFLENINTIYHVDVLYDDNNLANIIPSYDSVDDFYKDFSYFDPSEDQDVYKEFKFLIGILYQGVGELNYGYFEVIAEHGEAPHSFWHEDILNGALRFEGQKKRLTSINSVKYNDKLYLNLSEISNEIKAILEISASFDYEHPEVSFELINGDTAYKVNPFELTSVGYNVLSSNPLNIEESDLLSLNTIRAVYITDYNDPHSILDTIPDTGKFQLHIIKSGSSITADRIGDEGVQFFIATDKMPPADEKMLMKKLEVVENGEDSAKIVWKVELLLENYNDSITIRIIKEETYMIGGEPPEEEDVLATYINEEAMLEDLLNGDDVYYVEKVVNGKKVANIYKRDKYNMSLLYFKEGEKQLNGSYLNLYRTNFRNNPGFEDDYAFGRSWTSANRTVGSSIISVDQNYGYDYHEYITVQDPVLKYGGFYMQEIPMIDNPKEDLFPEYFKSDFTNKALRPVLLKTDVDEYKIVLGYFHSNGEFLTSSENISNLDTIIMKNILNESGLNLTPNSNTSDLIVPKKTNTEIIEMNLDIYSIGKYFKVGTASSKTWSLYGTGECPAGQPVATLDNDPLNTYCPTVGQYGHSTDTDLCYVCVESSESIKYYVYNGNSTYTIDDFVLYSDEPAEYKHELYSFTTFYNISFKAEPRVIESIDLSKFKMIGIKDRLCLYAGNTLWFSHLFKFNYFPEYNYVVLPLSGDDEIVRVAYFRGTYIIFTRYNLYRISGTFASDDFEIVLISDEIGCTSGDSIRNINNTLIFLSSDGLYTIKQNHYVGGLENVEKVDKQIRGVIDNINDAESLLYNEQYLLFLKNYDGSYNKTLKQYYNMELQKNMYPYTVDIYKQIPDNIFKLGNYLYSIKEGMFYQYDRGYKDFYHPDYDDDDLIDKKEYTYKTLIRTPHYMLGYPTHNKKFKNLYIKTRTSKVNPIKITVYIDSNLWVDPQKYEAYMTEHGEIVYYVRDAENIVTRHTLITRHAVLGDNPSEEYNKVTGETDDLGEVDYSTEPDEGNYVENVTDFTTGIDIIGDIPHQVHKLVVAGKGKSYAILMEHELDEMFGILDLGVLYKLGKVKEG